MELLAGYMGTPKNVTTLSFGFSVPVPPSIDDLSEEIPKSPYFVLSYFFLLAFGGFRVCGEIAWFQTNRQIKIMSSNLNKGIHRYNLVWKKKFWMKSYQFRHRSRKTPKHT